MTSEANIEDFNKHKPKLMGIAYRMLGSRVEAEDAVQDTCLKWLTADQTAIDNTEAWLTAVCSRRCLDILKSAYRKRTDYIGPWLPEPVITEEYIDPLDSRILSETLTTAFLLVMERLSPKERAAYLLREIFETPYADIAPILNIKETACRQLVSRAKSTLREKKSRTGVPMHIQQDFIAAFKVAIEEGDLSVLSSMLASDVCFSADGGGKVPALGRMLEGITEVSDFISAHLVKFWAGHSWEPAMINSQLGVILKKDQAIQAIVSVSYGDNEQVKHIYAVRNPDKISQMGFGVLQ